MGDRHMELIANNGKHVRIVRGVALHLLAELPDIFIPAHPEELKALGGYEDKAMRAEENK